MHKEISQQATVREFSVTIVRIRRNNGIPCLEASSIILERNSGQGLSVRGNVV